MTSIANLNFPAIRGVQAGREYYTTMWTLRMLRQISIFDDSMKVSKIYNSDDLKQIQHSELIDSISFKPDTKISPAEFYNTFNPIKSASNKGAGACEYWVKVCDKVSENSKSIYKQRMGEVWRVFHPRSSCEKAP